MTFLQVHDGFLVVCFLWVSYVDQNFRILFKPVLVCQVLKCFCCLNPKLSASLLVFVHRFSLCPFQLLNVLTKLTNLLDEVHVICHDLQSVSLVNLTLNIKSFFKRVNRVFEELFLVFVLLFYVKVDFATFLILVLDEIEQTLVYGDFKLLVIIGVLDNLIYSILKVVDVVFISPNCVSKLFNRPLDDALGDSQVFN